MKKTAQFIEEIAEANSVVKPKRKMHPNSLANLVAPWTPENKPKSPGRPRDEAAEISRAAFANNRQAIYDAVAKQLLSGNPYAYSVHSDRGYGKLKEIKEVTHIHGEVADADLNDRIAQLERDLGLAGAIDAAGRTGIAQAGADKASSHKEDTPVLS